MKIGFDPGNKGAIAFLSDDNKLIRIVDMPLVTEYKKQKVNVAELVCLLNQHCWINFDTPHPKSPFLENVTLTKQTLY